MKIVVKTTTQMQFILEAEPSNTIADLKAQIQAKEDILIDDQILLLNNIRLQDDRTLSSYGIDKEPAPRLTFRIYEGLLSEKNMFSDERLWKIHQQCIEIIQELRENRMARQLLQIPPEDPVQVIRSNQEKSDLPPGLRFRGRNC
ncbi:Ubiquitin-like [Aphelenchoides besseyi]|nr:Ubiquitin-like [Aphelenchoides besseyi]